VRDGDRSWIWTGADFIPRPGNATPSTPAHQTRTRGNLQVSFRLGGWRGRAQRGTGSAGAGAQRGRRPPCGV